MSWYPCCCEPKCEKECNKVTDDFTTDPTINPKWTQVSGTWTWDEINSFFVGSGVEEGIAIREDETCDFGVHLYLREDSTIEVQGPFGVSDLPIALGNPIILYGDEANYVYGAQEHDGNYGNWVLKIYQAGILLGQSPIPLGVATPTQRICYNEISGEVFYWTGVDPQTIAWARITDTTGLGKKAGIRHPGDPEHESKFNLFFLSDNVFMEGEPSGCECRCPCSAGVCDKNGMPDKLQVIISGIEAWTNIHGETPCPDCGNLNGTYVLDRKTACYYEFEGSTEISCQSGYLPTSETSGVTKVRAWISGSGLPGSYPEIRVTLDHAGTNYVWFLGGDDLVIENFGLGLLNCSALNGFLLPFQAQHITTPFGGRTSCIHCSNRTVDPCDPEVIGVEVSSVML